MAITVKEFTGMDNVARQGIVGRLSDGSPAKAAAKIVHNLNVTTDMKLVKRDGYSLWQTLSGAHSIFFDGAAFLCAAKTPGAELGAEKIVNGGFDTDTVWLKNAGFTISGGGLVAANAGVNTGAYQTGVVELGKAYSVTYSILTCTQGGFKINLGGTFGPPHSAPGTYTDIVTSTGTFAGVHTSGAAGTTGTIDNISVKEVVTPASAALESLYRVSLDKQVTELCPIAGLDDPLSYVRANGLVYISSRMWNGVLDGGSIRSWGAEYGDDPAMLDDSANSEEMMLLNTSGPPCMENLCKVGGRIFGSVGSRVHFNDPPFALEMFRPDSFHDFSEPLVMIAVANEGFYFAGETKTWFAKGYDPADWTFDVVGDGAIAGSLQVAPQYKQFDNVPMWLNKQGVQAGIGGSVQQITQDKVRFNAAGRAASVYRQQGGGQYISNFILPPDVGFGDQITGEVVRNGKLIT